MRMKVGILCVLLIILPVARSHANRVDEPATVEGRVTTTWGTPLGNVKVSFYQLEGISGISKSEKLVQQTTADEKGNYKVANLPWGQYRIEFSSSYGHTEVWRFYLWRSAKRILDISIPMGYNHILSAIQVSGSVVMSNGLPIENATVSMISVSSPDEYKQTRTDKNGKYEFQEINPGQYIICATTTGFMANSTVVDLGNGEKASIDIKLKSGKTKGA